jgi:hypothetical protein
LKKKTSFSDTVEPGHYMASELLLAWAEIEAP